MKRPPRRYIPLQDHRSYLSRNAYIDAIWLPPPPFRSIPLSQSVCKMYNSINDRQCSLQKTKIQFNLIKIRRINSDRSNTKKQLRSTLFLAFALYFFLPRPIWLFLFFSRPSPSCVEYARWSGPRIYTVNISMNLRCGLIPNGLTNRSSSGNVLTSPYPTYTAFFIFFLCPRTRLLAV